MNPRLTSRIALGGISAAVAATALVGATTGSAQAVSASTSYSCTTALGAIPSTVTVDIAILPSTAPAGFPVPAGLLAYNSTITAPSSLGLTSGKSDDFSIAFGPTTVPAPVSWSGTPSTTSTTSTYSGKGANAAFVTPAAGTFAVTMPAKFTLLTTVGGAPVSASCTSTAAPASVGNVTLSKQATTLKAKAKAGAVKVKVTNEYAKTGGEAVTGKVVVKSGSKKVGTATIKNGKATVKLKGLKKGANKLKVSYAGDDFSSAAKAKVTVTVKK